MSNTLQNIRPNSEVFPLEDLESANIRIGKSTAIKQPINLDKNDNLNETSEFLSGEVQLIDEDVDFPEGGLHAYLNVLGTFFALTITFGLMNTFGAVQAYLTVHQLKNESSSAIGWTFSIYYLVAYAFCIFAGPLFDAKGARLSMISGSVLLVAGLVITANCAELYQFLIVYGLIVGTGTCLLYTSSLGSVSHYFKKKRATAMGICSIGASAGGVIWSLMLRELFPKIGYAWSMRVLALCCAVCAIMSCCLVKNRFTKQDEDETVEKNPFKILKNSLVLQDLYYEKRFLSLTLAIFFSEFSLLMVMTYLTSYTIHQGYSDSDGFLVLIVTNSVGIIGRIVPNYLGDIYGSFNIVIVSVGTCAASILGIWLPFGKSLILLYVFAALYGFSSSSTVSLTPVSCGQISRTEDFGKRYGTVYFISSFGNLLSLPIGGALIKNGPNGYQNFIILAGVTEVLSAFFFLLTRYYCVGFRLCKV